MEDENYIYLRFPVQILKCDFGNMKKLCNDAMQYGIIERMKRHNLTGIEGFGKACELVGITVIINKHSYLKQCNDTYNQYKDSVETIITCSIKRDLLFEFMNKPKTEFEITVFRFFIALNSIQGMKPYGQTTYDRVFAVMLGYNTDKVLKHGLGKHEKIDLDLFTTPEDRVIYLKYSTQTNRQKIVEALELHWHLKWVGATYDGSFFSWELGYKALNTIKRMAVIKRKKPKEKLKRDKKKGREDADKELKDRGLLS